MSKAAKVISILLLTICTLFGGCGNDRQPTNIGGILTAHYRDTKAPDIVHNAMSHPQADHLYECLLDPEENNIGVYCLQSCGKGAYSDGYGVTIIKNHNSSSFPDIMHGKNPKAWFLEQENRLYLAGTVMEGTGTHVEQLYQVDFSDDNATVSKIVDPYDVQQQICKQLTYRINDDKINLYADSKHLATVINSISQMGDFFPDSTVWVGEQLSYDLGASTIKISFVPGVRFEGSKALFYDDMPTLLADLEITKDGFSVTNIRLESQTKEPASTTDKTSNPYVGQYLDEDNRDPNLRICEEKNGKYSIRIGINRLTNLDDGVGALCAEGLSFTATDASGNPITGLITVYDGNATVTFTNSTWELLPNNSSFRYTKQPQSDKIFTLVHNAYEKTDTPSDEKTRYYCSKDWKNLKQQIDSIDQKTDGIGFFEADYWYSGQDIDKNAKITDLKIERLSDAKAKLSGTLHNFSNQPIVLQLVTEEGEWKIDNFIFGENSEVNWKDMMENYVRDASRNRN